MRGSQRNVMIRSSRIVAREIQPQDLIVLCRKLRSSIMRFSKLAVLMGAAVALVVSAASASSATTNDPCKVLTAGKFSEIMSYTATIDRAASTQISCFYQGPEHSGGQFMILTESASGPQADMMLNSPGSSPPADSGLIGGSYRQGSIIFSVSIRSKDQAKLLALVAEIKHNLK